MQTFDYSSGFGVDMCTAMGKTGIPLVPPDENVMGTAIRRMGMGIKISKWKNANMELSNT